MVVEEKRVTWYSRIWSWTPASLWDAAIEKAGQVPAAASATTIDFEECPPFRGMESVKRRNAVRNRNRKGRQHYNTYGLTRNSSKNDGWETETPLSEIKTPVKTMFDWYHPWKMESTEKTISLLPATQQPVFRDSIAGNCEQLQQYLESLEFIVDTSTVVNFADEKGRRAIHFASAFGHFDIIELLLSYGANPNALDSSNSITPLACGAVNGNEKIMELLITKGANINYGLERDYRTDAESESHTALSWAVRTENAKSVKYLLEKGALLAGTTINWETPLHEAAYLGNIDILKLLVQNERNLQSLELRGGKDKNTPLNVAVEQGHLDCMEFLLSVGAKPNKFNIYGQTSLQLSAMTKDFQAIQLLIKNGADVNTRDTRNRTPLHHCIQFASLSNYVEAIQCIETLLYNGADINAQDENGFTPFNTAVDNGASTIVATLLKQGADLTITNNAGQSGVEILVKKMPHAIRYIRESLDFAIFVKQNDIADPDCTISFDFRPIIVTNNNEDVKTSTPRKETEVLLSFCAFGHYDILSHPLVEAFLVLKWERVMKYFWASFIANLLMVLVYSYFVFHLYASMCPLTAQNVTVTTPENILIEIEMPDYLQMIWYLLCLMIFVFTIKELVQLVLSPKSYFKMGENYIQLIFIILALLTILPDPLGPVNFKGDICHCLNRWNHIHYRSAAVSVVVAWFLILLRIGKLPKLGLYVQMFFKVVGNFGLFVIAYSSIVIGFTLSFGILLDDVNDEVRTFSNIFHSFLSTMVMMTGELELSKVIEQTGKYHPLFVDTYIVFTAFLLLVTVVLMNLLVGLAVSDIQGLREGAKVARLSRLVVAISQLESMLFSNGLINILPNKLIKHLRKNALFANEYKMYTFNFRPHDPRDMTLPSGVQMEALQILEKRESDRIRNMKKAEKEIDTKLELIERLEKVETMLQNLDKFMHNIPSNAMHQ